MKKGFRTISYFVLGFLAFVFLAFLLSEATEALPIKEFSQSRGVTR